MAVALELLIDASGMQRGAQQAAAALDSVTKQATATEAAARRSGAALSSAFQVTGGTTQIAQGISQAAKAFGELNFSAGAFAASRSILEVAKTAQDFSQLRVAVGASGGAFSVLGTIMKAHPLLTIATVISAAASALSLFGSATKEAASSWETLGQNMAKARLDERTAAYLGISTASAKNQQLAQVYGATANALSGTGGTVADVAASSGIGRTDLLRYLASQGNAQAREYLQTGRIERIGSGQLGVTTATDPGTLRISPTQLQDILRQRYQQVAGEAQSAAGPSATASAGFVQFGANNSLAYNSDLLNRVQGEAEQNYVQVSQAEKAQIQAEVQAQAAERIAANMERAAAFSEQIGVQIGGAIADVLTGANSLRGAIGGLAQSLGRQGLQAASGALFSAIGKTLFQSAADAPATGSKV